MYMYRVVIITWHAFCTVCDLVVTSLVLTLCPLRAR